MHGAFHKPLSGHRCGGRRGGCHVVQPLAGTLVLVVASLLLVDNDLVLKLIFIAAGLIFFKHLPAISRMLNGREFRLSFEEDITYKLDQKF